MQEKYIGMCFCVYDGESFDDHVRGQICQIPVKWTMAILLKATLLPVSDINYDYIFWEKKAKWKGRCLGKSRNLSNVNRKVFNC